MEGKLDQFKYVCDISKFHCILIEHLNEQELNNHLSESFGILHQERSKLTCIQLIIQYF